MPFFSSTSMLLWGMAAAAPILIHLWNRHRYQEMQWAAMQYLLAAIKKNSRRIHIEQLLLLIVRCLILLVFALALSNMSCSWSGSFGQSLGVAGTTHHLLVIDGSYSMDYQQEGITNFEKAKQSAKEIVASATQGDGFTLLLMGDSPQVIIAEPAYDQDDILREIDQLQLVHSGAKLAPTLAELKSRLTEAEINHPRLKRNQIVFISDMGKNTWEFAGKPDESELLTELKEKANLSLVNVGQTASANYALVDVAQELPFAIVGTTSQFNVQVAGGGDEASGMQRAVRMYVDGEFVSQQIFDSSLDTVTLRFSHLFEVAGDHHVEFRLDDDSLAIDNHRWQAVQVKPSLRFLCVAGQPGAATHLASALQPNRTRYPTVRPEVVYQSALLELDLLQYDAVMLVNIGELNIQEAKLLTTFVKSGGGLTIFLGDRVQGENYNQLLYESKETKLLESKLVGISDKGNYQFDPREYKHALLQAFRGQQDGILTKMPIWNYYQVEKPDDNLGSVALWFDTGDPAIIVTQPQFTEETKSEVIRPGKVALFCLPASNQSVDNRVSPPTAWTYFSTWPSFPAIIQELVIELTRNQDSSRNLMVGQPILGRVAELPVDATVDVVSPSQQRSRVAIESKETIHRWLFDQTQISGIYQMLDRSREDQSQSFAVNVDPAESDLTKLAQEDIPEQFKQPAGMFQSEVVSPSDANANGTEVFRLLLILVLLLIFAESMMAWRFGTGAA